MLALVLHLTLAVDAQAGVQAIAGAPRAARLVAEEPSAPPLLDPGGPSRESSLRADIASLNQRIAAINVNWPTGAVIMSYAGGIVLYAILVSGLLVALTSAAPPAALLVLISLGVAGAGLLIAGLVVGMNAAAAAKAERDALIQEREGLDRELKQLEARPSIVDRAFPAPPLTLTLARF